MNGGGRCRVLEWRAAYSAMLVHAGPELDIHANKHNVVNKRSNQKHYLVRNRDRENIKRED